MTNLTEKQKANLTARIDMQCRNFEDHKAKFIAKLDDDPAYALEWSADLFNSTGKYEVAKHMKALVEGDATLDDIKSVCLQGALQRNGGASRSTSITANIVADATCDAYKAMYEDLKYI